MIQAGNNEGVGRCKIFRIKYLLKLNWKNYISKNLLKPNNLMFYATIIKEYPYFRSIFNNGVRITQSLHENQYFTLS